MVNDNAQSNSSNLIAEAKAIADNAKTTFGSLTAQQIGWKPSADQWSIGQCFDHLITANRCYFPVIETIIRGEKKSTVWERLPFLPNFFGKMLIKYLAPRSTRKLKSPTIFKPSSGAVDENIITRFYEEQARLILLMERTRGLVKFLMPRNITQTLRRSLLRSGFNVMSLSMTTGETYSPTVRLIRFRSSSIPKDFRIPFLICSVTRPVTTPVANEGSP